LNILSGRGGRSETALGSGREAQGFVLKEGTGKHDGKEKFGRGEMGRMEVTDKKRYISSN